MKESEQTLESLVPTARLIAVGLLLAELAHELNNSLQGVLGYFHLLISSPLAPDAQPGVRRIVEEARRTTEILGRLLYVARPEVAERNHDEEAARESEQRFRSLLEQTSDALIVVDEDGRIVAVLRSLGEVRRP